MSDMGFNDPATLQGYEGQLTHMLALHHLPEELHEKVVQFQAPQTKCLKEKIPNALSTGELLLVFFFLQQKHLGSGQM